MATDRLFVFILLIFVLAHLGVQWWDAVQQVNRPHGWAFSKITNGVIRDMKLWKVALALSSCPSIEDGSARGLEFRYKRRGKCPRVQ